MKHIRNLEYDQPLDELIRKRVAERAFSTDESNAGLNFMRGLIIALAISLSFYATVYFALF